MKTSRLMLMISLLMMGRKSKCQMTGMRSLFCACLWTLTITLPVVPVMHDQSFLLCKDEAFDHDRMCLHGRQLLWAMVQL